VDTLLLVDRDEASVTAAARELAGSGAAAEPFVADVTDRESLAGLTGQVREAGTLRAVARDAGISPTMADWRRVLAVDLVGTALLCDALRPLAVPGTATVCFASMAPLLATTELAGARTRAIPRGVRRRRAHLTMGRLVQLTPLRRAGLRGEFAAVVAFLLSDEAAFVNGTDILIDGAVIAAARDQRPGRSRAGRPRPRSAGHRVCCR